MFGVFVNIYYYHYQIAYTSYQVFIMDDNSFDGLYSLDFNTDMYYEDEWSNIGGNLKKHLKALVQLVGVKQDVIYL